VVGIGAGADRRLQRRRVPAGGARPPCDLFELTVGQLKKKANDVVVGITSAAPDGTIAEFDLYVYDATGAEVGRGTELGSNDTVTLRDVAPGTYTVGVQSPLSTDPTARYDARAHATDAGAETPIDEETPCGFESSPQARELDRASGQGVGAVSGDPLVAADGTDTAGRISLDVLVYLDGVTESEAQAIFERADEESYAPLGIDLRVAEFRAHTFGTDDGIAIINATKRLVGGARPAGVDIVEALVGHDIQQLGQKPIAGIADCIGGVAHADRAFLVAEAHPPTDVAIGPIVFDYAAAAHVTAHEIGHLLGGQHHYANCVEGVDPDDVHEDHVEGSPCTLMFNAADFLGGDFDTLNGLIVRGSVARYAQP
jgi:hypothetical protein